MTRIVEHRSALPFGPVVEVHVRYNPEGEFPVWSQSPFLRSFPSPTDSFKRSHTPGEPELPACGLTEASRRHGAEGVMGILRSVTGSWVAARSHSA